MTHDVIELDVSFMTVHFFTSRALWLRLNDSSSFAFLESSGLRFLRLDITVKIPVRRRPTF